MKLQAQVRDAKITDMEQLAAVCYGPDVESISLAISRKEFEKTLREAGTSTIIDLGVEGGDDHEILIKEIQRHPVSEEIQHVDLYAIKRGVEMEIAVAIEFVNEDTSAAVKAGGVLSKVMHEVLVKCKPRNIPSELTADLALIEEIGQSLSMSQIVLPEGVAFVSEIDDVVASVSEVRQDAGEGEEGPDLTEPAAEGEEAATEGGEEKTDGEG